MNKQTREDSKLIKTNALLERKIQKLEQFALKQKKMADTLQKREAKYRAIVENMDDAIYIFDLEGNILDVNGNACKMVGYKRNDLIGANLTKIDKTLPHPADEMFEQLIRDGSIVCDRENVLKDGSVIPVEVSSKIISLEGKGIVHGFVRDITERKRAEKALRESEALYRLLAENISDVIWVSDMNLNLTYVSPSIEKIQGNSADEWKSLGFSAFLPQHSWKQVMNIFEEEVIREHTSGRDQNRNREMEFEIKHKDGSTIWVEAKASFLRSGNGAPIGIIGVTRNISERKRVEEALRYSENRYRALFETSQDGIFIVDQNKLNFLAVNDAACRLYGYTKDEFLKMKITDISAEPEKTKTVVKNCVMDIPLRFHRKKDGTVFPVEIVINYFQLGNDQYHTAFIRDITERKRMEGELRSHGMRLEGMVKERTTELEIKSKMLEEINVALKVLLHQREVEKQESEERFMVNIKSLILPYIEKMKSDGLDARIKAYVNIVESNLNDLTSSLVHNMRQLNFTPKETIIASLIKDGKTTKDIAETMGIGISTINSHRNSIRKKLALIKKKANLQSYLHSLK